LRVVAATHRDLETLAHQDRFRSDLLGRLSGFVVRLPALRERLEDFGLLTASLLARYGTRDVTISSDAMRALLSYGWPLNIRELEHCMRAALALSPTRVELAHLPASVREPNRRQPLPAAVTARPALLSPEQLARREQLYTLMRAHGGNISAVAREMGKDRVQIRRWIKSLAISVDELVGRRKEGP
jgi:transcriptional regulator of acetoin/glycerol metabolism